MKYAKYIIAIAAFFTAFTSVAQDGEQLFKKCATCHSLEKESTGPMLQGVKAKWDEAGELDLLYKWVQNSADLIASGESKMAAKIKDYSPTAMSAQNVTPEEVDAILDYVDNWVKPVDPPAAATAEGGEKEVVYVADYKENLTLFYVLLATIGALLVAILIMSGSIIRLVNSDYFKKKVGENFKSPLMKTLALLIGFTVFFSNDSHALTFNAPGEAEEGMPWLLVENIDIYVMVIINLILVGVLFYLRRLFKTFVNMTKKEEELVAQAEAEDVMARVNKVLTDVVPIEEEHTILMHHEYDGIRELDNNLPPWWVWGFYITIFFAIGYIVNYHVLGTADLQIAAYEKEMEQAEKDIAAYREKNAMNVDETNVTLLTEDSDLGIGKDIFATNCAVCHSDNGEGNSGPNLTDKNWIYGFDIKDVFSSVKNGRPGGMPEHKSKLNPKQLQQVASFVLSLPETEGNAPQGEIVEP